MARAKSKRPKGKGLFVNIDPEIYQRFREKCFKSPADVTHSAVVERLIRDWLADGNEMTDKDKLAKAAALVNEVAVKVQ